MSGGSYDYFYLRVEEMAENIPHKNNPRRVAFKELLKLVAEACHAIEWVDSCDYGAGDENKTIEACLGFLKADPPTLAKAVAFDCLCDAVEKIRGSLK